MPRRPRQLPPWIKFRLGQTRRPPQSTPFNGQSLTPDVHLAHAVQLAATPQSEAGQFSRGEPRQLLSILNDAPVAVVPIADQSTNEDAGFSFTVPPYSFIDVDAGDILTLSASLADGSPLPAWLSFDPVTQTFSGTPLNDDVGALTIRVTATDTSGATATQDFTVTVINTNDGPVASATLPTSPPMRTRASASPLPPTASAMWMWATRSPCQPLLPTAARFPPGSASIRQPRLSPARRSTTMSGALTIRVTATDTSGATATQDFQVTVNNTNDGPVASAVIADQSTNEDAGFSFTVRPAASPMWTWATRSPCQRRLPMAARFRPGSASIREPTDSPVRP